MLDHKWSSKKNRDVRLREINLHSAHELNIKRQVFVACTASKTLDVADVDRATASSGRTSHCESLKQGPTMRDRVNQFVLWPVSGLFSNLKVA